MTLQLDLTGAEPNSYTWLLSNSRVASVDENGLVTALAAGKTRIYTVVRGKVLVCNITVKDGLCGDINFDNEVTLIDAVLLNKHVAGIIPLNDVVMHNADCCDDGEINALDVLTLLSYLSGITESLPYKQS